MRPEIATLDVVHAAIKKLQAEGAEPTATRILAITGGSKGTVLRHMKELGFGAGRRAGGDPEDNVLPAVLLEKAKPFIAELLAGAAEIERAQYNTFTDRYHHHMAELEDALVDDGKRIEVLTEANATLAAELSTTREELEFTALDRDELQEKLKAMERRAREAEMRVLELQAIKNSLELAAKSSADLEARMIKLVDERLKANIGIS